MTPRDVLAVRTVTIAAIILDRDDELMTQARFGDNDAFAELVNRHKDMVVNYLTRLTGGRLDAEDLAQETFLRLFTAASDYRNQGKFKGYLMKIATNIALSHARKTKRQRILFAVFSSEESAVRVDQRTPQSQLLASEAQLMLLDALAALPWRFRVPLVLRETEDLSYETIAGILNCSQGTVKSRISRGRSRLKKKLAPYLDGVKI
jgi:RNA polymerase sigma-70 factor (ECF subfamily)